MSWVFIRSRFFLLKGGFSLFLGMVPFFARAVVAPAPPQVTPVQDVQVTDEKGKTLGFKALATKIGEGPLLVLPLYTACSASCPILTQKLKHGVSALPPSFKKRVVVFSFDPQETGESLKIYREKYQVPADWKLVRAEAKEVRRFFEFLNYSIMTARGELVHPNQIFLLDSTFRWRMTFVGVEWTAHEFVQALDQVAHPTLKVWIQLNPQELAWFGIFGLGVCIGFIFYLILRVRQVRPS